MHVLLLADFLGERVLTEITKSCDQLGASTNVGDASVSKRLE